MDGILGNMTSGTSIWTSSICRSAPTASSKAFAKELWSAARARRYKGKPDLAWKAALDEFPPAVQRAWNDKGMGAECLSGRKLAAAVARAEINDGSLHPIIGSFSAVGLFTSNDRMIRYARSSSPSLILDYPYGWKGMVDVCGHEISHFVDWVSGESSQRDGFLDVFERERDLLDQYGNSDPAEFFADACWICLRFPSLAERFIPDTLTWMRKFFENAWKE